MLEKQKPKRHFLDVLSIVITKNMALWIIKGQNAVKAVRLNYNYNFELFITLSPDSL